METKQSILDISTSLKEFKKELNDVKGAMLGLSKESKEYAQLAEKASAMQKKLNEVMYDSKNTVDSDKNSIKALSDEFKRLKDEASKLDVGSDKFKELAKQALDVNEKLKSAEASMGIFNRNVGDYSNQIIDAFGKMGVNIGGLNTAFGLATKGGQQFNGILTVISKHWILATITALVAIFMKLKDAIGNSEESSKKWAQAMSAFEPITNAITNGIGFLADKLADVMLWISTNLPSILQKVGAFAKQATVIGGKIVDVILFIPKKANEAMTKVHEIILGGLDTLVGGAEKVLRALRMNDIADNLRNGMEATKKAVSTVDKFIDNLISNASNYVVEAGNSIDRTLKKVGDAMTTTMTLEKQRQGIIEAERKQLVANAEAEQKVNSLRERIAEETDPKKRLELLKEQKKLIEENGKAELQIAKDKLDYQKKFNSLTVNSAEDNQYIAELEASLKRVEGNVSAQLVKVNKQIRTNGETIVNETSKATQKATQQAIKDSKEIVTSLQGEIGKEMATLNDKLSKNKGNKEDLQSQGLFNTEEAKKSEEERYTIVKESFEKQKALYEEALKNDKLMIDERNKLEIGLQNTLTALSNNEISHKITNNKIWLKDLKETNKEALEDVKENADKQQQVTDAQYTDKYITIAQNYAKGVITEKEYIEQMQQLEREYQNQQIQDAIDESKKRVDILEQEYKDIAEKFGSGSTEALEAHKAFEQAKTDVTRQEAEQRKALADQEVEDKDKTAKSFKEVWKEMDGGERAKSSLKNFSKVANAISDLGNTIVATKQTKIKADLESGKISQEEAEKEFERTKKVQIAMATISMLAGVSNAVSGAFELGPIMGPIMAAINSATVIASGVAQIREIKKQTLDGGGSSASSSPSTPSIAQVQATPLLNERMDEQSLTSLSIEQGNQQQDNRVYILQSDITQSNQQVEVRQQETTF